MEFLEGPDLFDYIAGRERTVPEATASRLAKQVFTAMHHLHRTSAARPRPPRLRTGGPPLAVMGDAMRCPSMRLHLVSLARAVRRLAAPMRRARRRSPPSPCLRLALVPLCGALAGAALERASSGRRSVCDPSGP